MHYQTGPFFYTLAFIAILIFMFGVGCLVHIWNLGKSKSHQEKAPAKWIGSLITSVFLQTQIYKSGVLAWIIHLCMFYGFFCLFLLTSIDGVLTWIVPHDSPVFHFFKDGTGSFFLALWGDFWGLVLLLGVVAALFRRYVLKPAIFHTVWEDVVAIWFLFAATVTGFICEAFRLVVHPAADGPYSFAVLWLVPYVTRLNPTEASLALFFYLHALLCLGFIAYIPFSKFKHVFTSPITFASVSTEQHYTRY